MWNSGRGTRSETAISQDCSCGKWVAVGSVRQVMVTGASGGIGGAVARKFAREGAWLHLVGQQEEKLRELSEDITKSGGMADVHILDIRNPGSVKTMVESLSGLDVAVNAAGAFSAGAIDVMAEPDVQRMVDVNILGTWNCLKNQLSFMKKFGGGIIINVGSNIGARIELPGLGAYAATKAAVSSLSRTAALEGLEHGVRVNTICPGPVDTEMSIRAGESAEGRDKRVAATNPSGRVASREEIASAIVWLASPEASYIVGQDIVIDGGASIG